MKRYGRKTAQGVWQPPDLCAMVTAWFRQRRNTHPRSAAGWIERHTQAMALCPGLQPSSAVVSAVVVGHSVRQQGKSPYCIRTDLVQNQKETGFRKWIASCFEVLLLQGVPALWFAGAAVISSEIKRKRTNVPMGELRLSGRTMINKEILIWQEKLKTWAFICLW